MVGRSGEFDELVEALGQGRHAVVHGPAGIGKTRLIRQVIDHSGQTWIRVAATAASASVPFGALAPLLPAGVDPLGVTAALRADWPRVATLSSMTRTCSTRPRPGWYTSWPRPG